MSVLMRGLPMGGSDLPYLNHAREFMADVRRTRLR